MIKWIMYSLLAYAALYAGVWLHEIGHSICQYSFGCRDNWLRVRVKPYIFFSTPGPVDMDKYLKISPWKRAVSAFGGVTANLFWTIAGGAVIAAVKPGNEYLLLFLWMFVTLNMAEIVSYLFIGNLYPVSDMAAVAQEYPRLRIPGLILGMALTAIYILMLTRVPLGIKWFVIVWNIITVASMCGGRIVFTLAHSRSKK